MSEKLPGEGIDLTLLSNRLEDIATILRQMRERDVTLSDRTIARLVSRRVDPATQSRMLLENQEIAANCGPISYGSFALNRNVGFAGTVLAAQAGRRLCIRRLEVCSTGIAMATNPANVCAAECNLVQSNAVTLAMPTAPVVGEVGWFHRIEMHALGAGVVLPQPYAYRMVDVMPDYPVLFPKGIGLNYVCSVTNMANANSPRFNFVMVWSWERE